MSDLRKAAQKALDAWSQPNGINYYDFAPYIEALRAALAQPEPKVGETWHILRAGAITCSTVEIAEITASTVVFKPMSYATQPERVPLRQGLQFVERVSAAIAQPEPEPVAWMYEYTNPLRERGLGFYETSDHEVVSIPLYATPPQRQPLTDDEIDFAYQKIWRGRLDDSQMPFDWIQAGIRYAEKAHGIGGQP